MQIFEQLFDRKVYLLLLLVFAVTFSSSFAQSGKVVEKPNSTPIQTPTPEKPVKQKSESDFIIDRNADKYKFVYLPVEEGKMFFVGKKDETKRLRVRDVRYDDFVEQLNREGEKGYKLVSVVNSHFALLKQDEVQHEYHWFTTESSFHFAKDGLEEKLAALAATGFRLVYHSLLSGSCDPLDSEDLLAGEQCKYEDFYLLSKEKNVNRSVENVLISSSAGFGSKPSTELEEQIDEKLAEGFYPSNAISAFEVVLEKTRYKNDLLSDKPDVQIVRSGWGRGDVMEKANNLGKQGYRLAMTNNRIAVMYRNSETAEIPVIYFTLKTDTKNLEKEIADLQRKGAIYKTFYPDARGNENTLIFELNLQNGVERAEFKILKFELSSKQDTNEEKVFTNHTPASKTALETMNILVKNGFEVRDLFIIATDWKIKNKTSVSTIGLILERRKQNR